MGNQTVISSDYSPSHPWFYYLGGIVISPKQIKQRVMIKDQESYRAEDFEKLNSRKEPRRSESLRLMKEKIMQELVRDISAYRRTVRELKIWHAQDPLPEPFQSCNDVHTSMSLIYSHISNDFMHLKYLDNLASKQMDLFD